MVDGKDIVFQQYDGNKILEINDANFVSISGAAAGPGELRFYEDTDLGALYTGFKAGNVTSSVSYVLPLADGTSGYALTTNGSGTLSWTIMSANTPTSADGQALGSASLEWSDLFLADSGTVTFGNDQDTILTHTDGSGLTLNSTNKLMFNDASQFVQGSSATVLSIGATDEIDLTATAIDINGTADVSGAFTTGSTIVATSTIQGTSITATTSFLPDAQDGAALGTTSLQFSDLFLADGAVVGFGDNNEVTLTHVHDTGLLLNSTMALQFNDASQYINAPSATVLDINATDEIELNATLVDINANVEISGTATTTGVHTFTAVPVFPNNTIETADIQDGQVTIGKLATAVLTGATDIGAAIVDADLFLVDDGAGGTLRKTTAARIKTYAATSGAVTGITSALNTSLVLGRDADNDIDFTADNIITFRAAAVDQVKLIDNVFSPVADSDVDLGTSSLYFKDAYIDTITTTGAITSVGKITADAGIDIDNFNIDGTTIALSSGDLTVDAAGDIILDAAGDQIFFHDAGTEIGKISMNSSNITLQATVNDKAMIFNGKDGGAAITALTLDMAAAGDATFNSNIITAADSTVGNGDGEQIAFNNTADTVTITNAGAIAMVFNSGGWVTMPLQPAFLCMQTTSISAETITDATVTTVGLNAEIFDVNGDFLNSVFTAPVTGKYYFQGKVGIDTGSSSNVRFDQIVAQIATSNRIYYFDSSGTVYTDTNDRGWASGSVLADMDANDTATLRIYVKRNGGTGTTEVVQTSDTSALSTYMSGYLVA